MRSIREYIRKTLFDSSSILSAYRLDAPQRVKDFAFVRAPVERLADVLSRGFVLPDKDHVYSLNSQWRVYDYSYEITSLPAVNDMRRTFSARVRSLRIPRSLRCFRDLHQRRPFRFRHEVVRSAGVFLAGERRRRP